MSTHQIHVFISHSWAYSHHYDKLSSWIFDKNWTIGQASLNLHDYSIPKDDPIHNKPGEKELKDAIFAKIAGCHVLVVTTAIYSTYSEWIKKNEIKGAKDKQKPILAVYPWGQRNSSRNVLEAADKVVGWNKKSVIEGIWRLYYQ